jgi:hypothetical protein
MSSFISIIPIFNSQAITQNSAISETVDLGRFNAEGFFSMQIAIVGAGNVDVIWSASNDGTNFIVPVGATDIYSAFGATSGPSSDGKSIVSFDPLVCKYLKFTATEQNAGAITSIVCHLAIQ